MDARSVEEAAARLRELRREGWERLGLAALVLGLALAATQMRPALAVALFLGGLVVGALGLGSLWRRWDLLDQLAGEPDAQVISEVRAFASREATIGNRHDLAASIRARLTKPGPNCEAAVVAMAQELEDLASELDDGTLVLEPVCAVACKRLLSELVDSSLDPARSPPDLRSRLCQIRSGFRLESRER